jgi:hypothetical protein
MQSVPPHLSEGSRLTPDRLQRAMRLSILEGVSWALMVGCCEAYFLVDGIRLGASPLELALLVGLPLFLGSFGPLLTLHKLASAAARRPIVVNSAVLQALCLFGLSTADFRGLSSPSLMIAVVALYQLFGQAAGTAWRSWYGDLIPKETRGQYFARRNRWVHVAACLSMLGAGFLLQRLEPSSEVTQGSAGGTGFSVLFALAGCFRLVSAGVLALSPEPRFKGLPSRARARQFLSTDRGRDARRLIGTIAALQVSVFIAAAFFTPYMIEDLSFTYVQFTIASTSIVVAKFALLPLWGRWIDSSGARWTFPIALVLVSLVPAPWLVISTLAGVIAAEAFSGLAWGAYELSLFSLLLDSSYRGVRPYLFAAQSMAIGLAQLCGSVLGAVLASHVFGDYRALFAISLVCRLLVSLVFARTVRLPESGPLPRGALLLRIVGLRWGGGMGYRPMGAMQVDSQDDPA